MKVQRETLTLLYTVLVSIHSRWATGSTLCRKVTFFYRDLLSSVYWQHHAVETRKLSRDCMNESSAKAELRRVTCGCGLLSHTISKLKIWILHILRGRDIAFVAAGNVLLIWGNKCCIPFINTCVYCWLAATMQNLRINMQFHMMQLELWLESWWFHWLSC